MSRKYSIREQFAHDIAKLILFCHKKGYGVTLGEAYRTDEQQRIHRFGWRFTRGRWIKLDKYVRSKVITSQHQKRLAKDLHIWDKKIGKRYISDLEWQIVGRYWENLNFKNRWGGRFGVKKINYSVEIGWDRWHMERRG